MRITRPVKATLISLGVSLPIALTSSDCGRAFVYGAPTLLISMSAYTLNDLHDVERDMENHPERPLPQQDLSYVAVYSRFMRADSYTRFSKHIHSNFLRADYPQYLTPDQSFYQDQAIAFLGLGYLEASELDLRKQQSSGGR